MKNGLSVICVLPPCFLSCGLRRAITDGMGERTGEICCEKVSELHESKKAEDTDTS